MYNSILDHSYAISGTWGERPYYLWVIDLLDNSDPPDSRFEFDITYHCNVEWADIVYYHGGLFRMKLEVEARHQHQATDQLYRWLSAWYNISMPPP